MARGGPKLEHGRRREMSRSFQDGGEHYHRVRPGYPAAAVDWLLPAGAHDVADLGAGTGKFTALLLERGLQITAVDPSADMLAQLHLSCPAATACLGSAEVTGLPDSAFDVVSAAQAWHWVDPVAASSEAARILRPGGTLALIWNQLDTTVPWVHRLSRIMHAGDVLKPDFRPAVGPEFRKLEGRQFRWEDAVTTHDIVELTKSRSYYLSAQEQTRTKVLANLDWYLHEHLGHGDTEQLGLPYVTQAWRATRP
ncbi:class I SAM-dependent methyltransferase [Pseudarthrobacter sp. J64]|uniref:class I SAM-dependent methyltransferase n=1 Tax=Pseudarthrobacter sp. J64 TaxID=3116485 RepID=UPI002E815193|nr:class I SAM-dependent methyltransferase [Pseudarthrobacter sp. J64]MEE2568346.1 class I SAM-dependent methyltransferase [Pseudarthrobacter sp. J64]